METTNRNLARLECFGTGLTLSGRQQSIAMCDDCRDAKPCLLRRTLAIERPQVQPPDAFDRFIPDSVRVRRV